MQNFVLKAKKQPEACLSLLYRCGNSAYLQETTFVTNVSIQTRSKNRNKSIPLLPHTFKLN